MVWFALLVVVIGGGLVWYFTSGRTLEDVSEMGGARDEQAEHTVVPPAGMTASTTGSAVVSTSTQPVTVTYNGSSFTPASVTIRTGQSVTFVDSSAEPMWIASDVHPAHTGYDGTNRAEHCASGYTGPKPFDECAAAKADYTFVFTKAGTWPFHNHLNPSATGKVVVQ